MKTNQITSQPSFFLNHSNVSNLIEQQLIQDTHQCHNLLSQLKESEKEISTKLDELIEFTDEAEFHNGIHYYNCKNLLMNEYLICLKFYQLFKLNGVSLTQGKGLSLYERLIYLKTLLMKLAPIEKKIQYQKDKLLKKGEKIKIRLQNQQEKQPIQQEEIQQIEEESDDILKYKPQPTKLIQTYKQKRQDEKLNQGKYMAPKQLANLPSSEKSKRRDERREDRQRARLIKKMMGDIDSGEQVQEQGMQNDMDKKYLKQYEQQIRREEWNMQRQQLNKKQKSWVKKMKQNQMKGNQLNDELKQTQQLRKLIERETTEYRRPESSQPKPKKKKKTT